MNNIPLIENHCHGAYGVNFNYCDYDEVKKLLKLLYKKNIKGVCPTLVGESDDKIYNQLKLFKEIKKEQMKNPKAESLILGVHLEGTFLNPDSAGIQDNSTFKTLTKENFKALVKDCSDIVKIVTLAPELDVDLINYLKKNAILAQAGHTLGEDLKKCSGVTHLFNAMKPIHHRNSSIAQKALIDDEIYVEVIFDLVHLSLDTIKLIKKVKPIDKIILISDSLPCAGAQNEIIFCGKKINPSGKDDKGKLAGSNKTLYEISQNLIGKNIFSKSDIYTMAFKNNIKYLNLSSSEIDILNENKLC